MKITKNISLEEVVPKDIYSSYGEGALRFIDLKVVYLAQDIRSYFDKPITINNWINNGNFNFRGFRPHYYSEKKSSIASQHRFGRALDFDIKGISAEEVREQLIKYRDNKFKDLTGLEMSVRWVHIDVRASLDGKLLMFAPR